MGINKSKIGEAFVNIHADNNPLRRTLRASGKMLRSFGSTIQRTGSAAIGTGGSILRTIGTVGLPFGLAIRNGMQFQDTMSAVAAKTQATAEKMKMLTDQAKELGQSTSFTASQVGGAQLELGTKGFKPDEIRDAIPHVLNLARATGTELPLAAKIAGATLRQFELDASKTGQVSDMMVATANNSAVTLESIAETLSHAGISAKDYNVSLEDTLALIGSLGNVGLQGSLAGTSIRRLLNITAAEADKLKEIFDVDFKIGGDAKSLIDSLEAANEATKDLGTAERGALYKEAFGLLGVTGASAIGKNADSVRELQAVIAQSEGVAARTAKQMDDNLGGSFRMMASAIESVTIALTEVLTPVLRSTMGLVQAGAAKFAEYIQANKQLVVQVFAGTVALGAFAIGLIAAGTALGMLGLAVSGVASGIGLIATTSGMAVTGALLLGTALLASTVDADEAIVGLQKTLSRLVEFFKPIAQGVKDAFSASDWKLAGQIAMAALKVAFIEGLNELSELIRDLMVKIATKLPQIMLKMVPQLMSGKISPEAMLEVIKTTLEVSDGREAERELNTLLGKAKRAADEGKKETELPEVAGFNSDKKGFVDRMMETMNKAKDAINKSMNIEGLDDAQKKIDALQKQSRELMAESEEKAKMAEEKLKEAQAASEEAQSELPGKPELNPQGKPNVLPDDFMKGIQQRVGGVTSFHVGDFIGQVDSKGFGSGVNLEKQKVDLLARVADATEELVEKDGPVWE